MEGIADLINAQTQAQRRLALAQMQVFILSIPIYFNVIFAGISRKVVQ